MCPLRSARKLWSELLSLTLWSPTSLPVFAARRMSKLFLVVVLECCGFIRLAVYDESVILSVCFMNLSIVNPLAISSNLTVSILLSSCINCGKYISFDIKERVIVLAYLHWLICVFVGAEQPLLAACFASVKFSCCKWCPGFYCTLHRANWKWLSETVYQPQVSSCA